MRQQWEDGCDGRVKKFGGKAFINMFLCLCTIMVIQKVKELPRLMFDVQDKSRGIPKMPGAKI
eukprot:3622422-Karenia_brevis.AAC.1